MKEGFIWYCLKHRPIKVIVNLFGYTKSTKKYLWFRDLVFFFQNMPGVQNVNQKSKIE